MNLNFLEKEFNDFLKRFTAKENSSNCETINSVGPSLDLEIFHNKFNANEINVKISESRNSLFKNLIMPSYKYFPTDKTLMPLTIQNTDSVMIRYRKTNRIQKYNCRNEFRLNLLTKKLNLDTFKYFNSNNIINNDIVCGKTKNILENSKTFNITPLNEIKMYKKVHENYMNNLHLHLPVVNVDRSIFWFNLFPIGLNYITSKSMKFVGDLNGFYVQNLNNTIILPITRNLEKLNTVTRNDTKFFEKITLYEVESFDKEILSTLQFQKKCVLNSEALKRDLIVEQLQLKNWLIFERLEDFLKDFCVFQVCKEFLIIIIPIQRLNFKSLLSKTIATVKIILEFQEFR